MNGWGRYVPPEDTYLWGYVSGKNNTPRERFRRVEFVLRNWSVSTVVAVIWTIVAAFSTKVVHFYTSGDARD